MLAMSAFGQKRTFGLNSKWGIYMKLAPLLLGVLLCAFGIGLSEADTPPSSISQSPAAPASATASAHDNEQASDWIIGKWRINGPNPDSYCHLTVTPRQLTWTEPHGGSVRTLEYRVVASENDFIIVQTQDDKRMQQLCFNFAINYVRFDRRDYVTCILFAKKKDIKSIEQECPRPFADNRAFDLTVYRSLKDAQEIIASQQEPGAVSYWAPYWKYAE
jgi:hypothetical protein